jgi:hypothetical protein
VIFSAPQSTGPADRAMPRKNPKNRADRAAGTLSESIGGAASVP